MKEITTMPVKVRDGNKEIEVYEYSNGFAMTREYIGRVVGYADPRRSMEKLHRRNKAALDPHQFVVTGDDKITRGRPPFFYDEEGIVKVFMLANTPQAREIGPKVIDYLKQLNFKRIARIEAYWFARRPFWPEIRDRVMRGQSFRMIAEATGRSAASVRNAVRRMIEVGILQARRAAQALAGTAKKAVLKYDHQFSLESRQLALPGFDGVTE